MGAVYAKARGLRQGITLLCAALLCALASLRPVSAHEVVPAIGDMVQEGALLKFDVEANLESFLAGINLSGLDDTNNAPEAGDYDRLRALPPADLAQAFTGFWPQMAAKIVVKADGGAHLPAVLRGVAVPEIGDVEVARRARFQFEVALPEGAGQVELGWDAAFGTLVLRQEGVEAPFTGYLEEGAMSEPIQLAGGGAPGQWESFFGYIPVGFDHIVPKGLDHILFVLGLFFLSTRLRPLLLQITSFTAAHTVTLALGALGLVNIPGSIVEPLIAASIVFVAVENLFTAGLSPYRPLVVFGFGLLHGLGFASVLGEFGLPEGAFIPALLGFNLGVEFGQLAVIAGAFLLVGAAFGRKPWYKARIANPASLLIALVGAYWVVERTLL